MYTQMTKIDKSDYCSVPEFILCVVKTSPNSTGCYGSCCIVVLLGPLLVAA